jgi:hypothetical protein
MPTKYHFEVLFMLAEGGSKTNGRARSCCTDVQPTDLAAAWQLWVDFSGAGHAPVWAGCAGA